MNNGSSKEAIITLIVKQGAWAVVACSILVYFGWQGNKLVDTIGISVSTYIHTSSENIVEMKKNIDQSIKNTTKLQELLITNTDTISSNQGMVEINRELIKQSQDNIIKIIDLMETAHVLMKDVPQQREKQIELMEELLKITKEQGNDR